MQLDKVLTSIGALVCTSLLGIGLTTKEVEAQTARPYVVFVNGQGNCCAWGMNALEERLKSLYGMTRNDFRYVPYSNFRDGGESGGGNKLDWSSVDSQFLKDGEDFLNNQLDRNRPLILIGHSYGGDSILKLLPRINRRIQLVAVIDPVSTGGFRALLSRYTVPSNVDYFFNRWQENVPFPNDFALNGSISCYARNCSDQDSENIARNADFSPITTECRWDELCPGLALPTPFSSGSKGTKQVRIGHQDLPLSAHIQKVLGDKIQEQLAEFRPPFPSVIALQGNFTGSGMSTATFYNLGNNRIQIFVNNAVWFDSGTGGFNFGSTRGKCLTGMFSGSGKTDIACMYDYGNFNVGFVVFASQGNSFSVSPWWTSGAGNMNPDMVGEIIAGDFAQTGATGLRLLYRYPEKNAHITMRSNGSSFSIHKIDR